MPRRVGVFSAVLVLALALDVLMLATGDLAPLWPSVGVAAVWGLLVRGWRELALAAALLLAGSVTALSLAGVEGATVAVVAVAHALIAVVIRVAAHRLQAHPAWPGGPVWSPPDGDPATLAGVDDAYRLFFASVPAFLLGGLLIGTTGVPGTWIVRVATSVIVVAGPVLAVRSRHLDAGRSASPGEIGALFLTTVVAQWLVFGSGLNLPIGYATLVLIVWSALRMPLALVAVHGATVAGSALVLALATGAGPFAVIEHPRFEELALQGYLLLATVLALVVGATVRERQGLVNSLARSESISRMAAAAAERIIGDAPHGMVVLDREGRVRRANAALGRLLNLDAARLVGRRLGDLPARDAKYLQEHVDRTLSGPDEHVAGEWDYIERSGAVRHLSFSTRRLTGIERVEDTVLVNLVDVSERRRYEQQLAHLADHDVLTGLANRRRFDAVLSEHEERGKRYGDRGALLLLDLDHFKDVNDTLGHAAGDELIVTVGHTLRSTFRATDVVARLGGDEFAVLLPEASQEEAELLADRVVHAVRERAATLDGVRRRISASVGVVTFAAARQLDADPLALADLLMYDAKENGRDRYAAVDEQHVRQPRTAAVMAWRSRLERAIAEDLFELHLQPILDVATQRVASAEALLRLVDEDEPVAPGRFVYIAEKHGLAPAMDAWVVRHAVPILARLRAEDPDFVLTVNVSGHSLGSPELEDAIVISLAEHGVDPSGLVVEVTETAAVGDVEAARDFGRRMKAIGVRLALDDFGAGFGSFYYLKHLDFDLIKIDGEFVQHATGSDTDQAIIRSIVGIARDLGKRTVAEFVSDAAVLDVVRRLGVDHAQGFLIGRPVREDEFRREHLGRQLV